MAGQGIRSKVIDEEYKIWKKNAPFLYDIVMTHALEWPSLTVQWVSDASIRDAAENVANKLVLGTHTSNGEQNYLMIASIQFPSRVDKTNINKASGKSAVCGKLEVNIRINHQGEVNRARYMPQNPFILATKSPSSEVYVFDVSRHPSSPKDDSFCLEHRCLGHTKEGYGLSWNHNIAGQLLSGSDDGRICLWNLNESNTNVHALNSWTGHSDVVEDVSWHVHSPHVFGSVGDDRQVLLWDTRTASSAGPFIQISEAHGSDINSIAFNPYHEFLLATGSADRLIKLWDIRNTSNAVHTLDSHEKEVFQIQWAPFDASVLASCGADRRIHVWDLRHIGTLSSISDDKSPAELLFIHGGHNDKISDLSWNTMQDWVMASVSDDNVLQIWRMGENIHARH